ncbi:alpha/beta hydrolase family protein [Sphingomonas arantia]|uniref:Alpha/beta hydrolase family protein n=1 Tax=Sphingomonas arantia TaxID=1460676 RepID=A0ABW4TUN5_9SPHN
MNAVAVAVEHALTQDPSQDADHPAETLAQAIASGGETLNALLYTAAGRGPHPTVLLLHGLPGNEQNVDLAQSLRRAGWNVLTFHYRGSWGSPGAFSFANCIADALTVHDWLRDATALRIDRDRLVVIGHSMGGFIAAHVAANRPTIRAVALISAADLGSAFGELPEEKAVEVVDETVGTSRGLQILAHTSPQALATEAASHADDLHLKNYAPALEDRPLLLCTSDDGFTPGSDALAAAMKNATGTMSRSHLQTDHSYSDHRIALQRLVLSWLLSITF